MAYSMITVYGKSHRSISAAAALLRGYHSSFPLSTIERRHLVLLIACRLATSVTLGCYSYSKSPNNEYLLLHAKPGWDALELIWGGDDRIQRQYMKHHIDTMFDIACNGGSIGIEETSSSVIDCSDLAFPDPSIPDPFSSIREKTTTRTNKRKQVG